MKSKWVTKTGCFKYKRAPIKLNPKISDEIYRFTELLDETRKKPNDIFDKASIMLKTAEHEIDQLRRVIVKLERTLKYIPSLDSREDICKHIEFVLKQKEEK